MATMKQIGTVAALTIVAALGTGAYAYSTVELPTRDEVAVTAVATPHALIDDPANVLSPEDEARVLKDATRLKTPDTVKTVHYLLVPEVEENVNDTVEEYLRDNRPNEIGEDKFADGVLIIGASPEQREVFAFAGEDVADQINLRGGERLDTVLEAMKPGMQDNNIPAALFAGARTATNAEEITQYRLDDASDDKTGTGVASGLGAGAGVGAVGSAVVARRNWRRKKIAQGREDYDLVTREYAELSKRLDSIDIRAHSLTSEFADIEMRKDWEEVRDRFLGLHETVSGAGGIGSIDMSDDKAVLKNHKKLADAAETIRHTSTAEDNINRLFEIEHGNVATRRADLTTLRKDVIRASADVDDEDLKNRLRNLEERIDWLDHNPDAPDYMDRFVRVLDDYQVVLDIVRTGQFADVEESEKLKRARLWDDDFAYPNFVTFVALNSWHTSNVETAESASSSTNTSFSSGFSGAGGSSGY